MVRQYDIEILQTIVEPSQLPQELSLTATKDTSRAVTGLQKLVQRYTLALLTATGTIRFDEAFGSRFWQNVNSGVMQNEGAVKRAFVLANNEAVIALKSEDSDSSYGDAPDEEKIESATLTDFDLSYNSGSLFLSVNIISKAGSNYNYKVPIDLLGGE